MEVAIPYFYSEKILVDMCKKNSYYAKKKNFIAISNNIFYLMWPDNSPR